MSCINCLVHFTFEHTPDSMPYFKHLSKDKILWPVVKQHGRVEVALKKNVCLQICASIIGQQLSTKVAAVIYARFLGLFKSKSPKPMEILAVPHEELRAIGLSNSKAIYIKNVSLFFIENKLKDSRLYRMNNEELLELLTQIKGVGRWTVEMIMMFALAREDIFSTGDLGLQKAMVTLYNIQFDNQKELAAKMLAVSSAWSPYRSYACRYLWKYLDTPKVRP